MAAEPFPSNMDATRFMSGTGSMGMFLTQYHAPDCCSSKVDVNLCLLPREEQCTITSIRFVIDSSVEWRFERRRSGDQYAMVVMRAYSGWDTSRREICTTMGWSDSTRTA